MKKIMMPLVILLFSNSIDVYAGKDKNSQENDIIVVGGYKTTKDDLCNLGHGLLHDLFKESLKQLTEQTNEEAVKKAYSESDAILDALIDKYEDSEDTPEPGMLIEIDGYIEEFLARKPLNFIVKKLNCLTDQIVRECTLDYLSQKELFGFFNKKFGNITSQSDEKIIEKNYFQCCTILAAIINKFSIKSNDEAKSDDTHTSELLAKLYSSLFDAVIEKTSESVIQKLYSLADKIINDSIKLQIKPDQLDPLIALFKEIYPSITFTSPKRPSQKKQAHSRLIYNRLNVILNSKKRTHEALDEMSYGFSDEEKRLKEFWSCTSNEELADPTLVNESRVYGFTSLTSHWKNANYEDARRLFSTIKANQDSIDKKEKEVAELLRLTDEKQNQIRRLNATLQAQKSKLASNDKYSKDLIEDLAKTIEDYVTTMRNCENQLQQLETNASIVRNDTSIDAKAKNERTLMIKKEQEKTLKIKEEAEEKKEKAIIALEHIRQLHDKVGGEGSFARQLGLIQ